MNTDQLCDPLHSVFVCVFTSKLNSSRFPFHCGLRRPLPPTRHSISVWVVVFANICKHDALGRILCHCRQIALADLTIINKTDLVNEDELAHLRNTVRSARHIL